MLLNNKFSTKNKLLYKMKCINTREQEYYEISNNETDRIEKYKHKSKK